MKKRDAASGVALAPRVLPALTQPGSPGDETCEGESALAATVTDLAPPLTALEDSLRARLLADENHHLSPPSLGHLHGSHRTDRKEAASDSLDRTVLTARRIEHRQSPRTRIGDPQKDSSWPAGRNLK